MIANLDTSATVANAVLLFLAAYAAWILAGRSNSLEEMRSSVGFKLIIAGLSVFAVFYIADFISVFVLPQMVGPERAASLMWYSGFTVSWFVNLLGTACMLTGFLLMIKAAMNLVGELEVSKTDLTDKLAANKAETVQLREITQKSAAAARAKSELLANVSHELRTPLNAIIGFSNILKKELYGPIGHVKYHEYAEDISQSGLHLLAIINDILDLSKIEAGQMELQEEIFDIGDAIGVVLSLVRESAETNGVAIKIDLAEDMPWLLADERRVKQIILNLLSNAVKFTPQGGEVTVKVWCSPKSGYVIQVSDTGIGIAPEDLSKVLAPFGQVGNSLNRDCQGTGIGLPLTKSLAEMHGGSLNIESRVGVGTTVTVRLPSHRIAPLSEAKAVAC